MESSAVVVLIVSIVRSTQSKSPGEGMVVCIGEGALVGQPSKARQPTSVAYNATKHCYPPSTTVTLNELLSSAAHRARRSRALYAIKICRRRCHHHRGSPVERCPSKLIIEIIESRKPAENCPNKHTLFFFNIKTKNKKQSA